MGRLLPATVLDEELPEDAPWKLCEGSKVGTPVVGVVVGTDEGLKLGIVVGVADGGERGKTVG